MVVHGTETPCLPDQRCRRGPGGQSQRLEARLLSYFQDAFIQMMACGIA